MPQDQLRSAIDALRARLQDELEAQLTSLTERQEQALEEARREAEAAADGRWSAKTERVRAEWAARLESEVAAAKAEAETQFLAEAGNEGKAGVWVTNETFRVVGEPANHAAVTKPDA